MNVKWQIIYFISSSGDNPVGKFLDTYIPIKVKAFRIFNHIKEYGLTAAIPHIKKLSGSSLWEIRILGGNNARILYVTLQENKILLLHAFIKKTNKTPSKEIRIALIRLREYVDK
ncbi:hypothetical protein A3C59_02600 [Candidatus Daviesbacteria bacterium RIFCSPHIGHO2_02_FULL_36_13]|uniref:Addiction module toxin RelE n=1 Tax=Candidatus Daviesbacteria bacterium RIFCSPHIGHO2_02_FULL_36_13 TaxID=1797768 RepID=A0A1F5JMT8_9BACT|nr:MAG: hypothetical protein A3C59_02600 [Candidatus Daviesbacteria bacterium RIFCSPHIGHO2_02_FULL_36_13]OGE42413.1 MAG: hypothetical protein A3A45_01555 [Candidatus Daviesbacteria bacterium RIFCSPLOWO2_01_FULL_36_8]